MLILKDEEKKMLDYATDYYSMGFSIIPLHSPQGMENGQEPYDYEEKLKLKLLKNSESEKPLSEEEILREHNIKVCKQPLVPWKEYQQKRPTKDDLWQWFGEDWPYANIGILTGRYHGLIVFDIDDQKALDFAESKGGFPDTPVAISGKGRHYYFKCPTDYCQSRADKNLGLDIRGDGGYIVVPPSQHGSSRQYQWQPGRSVFEVELAECSPWMIEYLKSQNEKSLPKNTISQTAITKHMKSNQKMVFTRSFTDDDIKNLNLSEEIKNLILQGRLGKYSSRSDRDQAVITSLLRKGLKEEHIFYVFDNFPVGDKYNEHSAPIDYLEHSIKNAKTYLKDQENRYRASLIISDCLEYNEKSFNYTLCSTAFTKYVVHNYKIKMVDDQFYYFTGRYYEILSETKLNAICQKELGINCSVFTPGEFKRIKHFIEGDPCVYFNEAQNDMVNYLNLENGLFDLDRQKVVPHTSDVFTTTALPFRYNESATCPQFQKFLNDLFNADDGCIQFLQEAVGYCLHKEVPTPALFLLIGNGANGKSVFLKTISHLFGSNNVASIGLNNISNEYYKLELKNKLINVVTETPKFSSINTDEVKAVVSGELVTGRYPHGIPISFNPYAKHFFAMNEMPNINDNSYGMWRRIYPVYFERTFDESEMDKDLENKLIKELSGIFNWALAGLARLKTNKFIFTKVNAMNNFKQQLKQEASGSVSYVQTQLSPDCIMPLKTIYQQYQDYCESEGFNIDSKLKFKKVLISEGFIVQNNTKDGNKVYIYGPQLQSEYV